MGSNPTRVIEVGGFSMPADVDAVTVAYPDDTTEVYSFRSGGSGGTVQMTITVVYTDSSKSQLSSAVRT